MLVGGRRRRARHVVKVMVSSFAVVAALGAVAAPAGADVVDVGPAVVATGSESVSEPGGVAVSNAGCARDGAVDVSVTGCTDNGTLQVSGTGDATGGISISGTGDASGAWTSVSGTGDAENGGLAVAPVGDATARDCGANRESLGPTALSLVGTASETCGTGTEISAAHLPGAEDAPPEDRIVAADLPALPHAALTLPSAPDSVDPALPTTAASAYASGARPSPSGCWGESRYPHKSRHQSDTVNAESVTFCPGGVVPYAYVRGQLWKREWWGWDRLGKKGEDHSPSSNSANAFSNSGCVNGVYRLSSYHEVLDYDGVTYDASTISEKQGVTTC